MHIADALGDWQGRSGPLYKRLASAIEDAISRGDLAVGDALPAERSLAVRLAVARSTIVGAYDQLRSRGLLESRQGSGTWVAGARRSALASSVAPEALRAAAALESDDVIELATASLPADPSVREAFVACAENPDPGVLESAGYFRTGLPGLRHAIADYLTGQGLPTDPDEVLVTTGDQQALSLLADHFLEAGDVAVVPDPTSPGVLDVLRSLPVTIRSCGSLGRPGAAQGLLEVIGRGEARLAYVSPSLDHEGGAMTLADRDQMLRGLRGWSGLLVCDESQRSLVFGTPPPPIGAGPGATTVVTLGSMSKLFWGGLRVGWIRAAKPVVARLARTKARADLGTPVISQMIATRLLAREPEVRLRRIGRLEEQWAVAQEVMSRLLPEFTYTHPVGGLTMWVRLPAGLSEPFAQVATREGVSVVPGSLLSSHGAGDEYLRIVYAQPADVFEEGARRLARAWQVYRRRAGDLDSDAERLLV